LFGCGGYKEYAWYFYAIESEICPRKKCKEGNFVEEFLYQNVFRNDIPLH
jgi:hypothetical protein